MRELAEPGKQNAAVKGLVALGDAAVPALHKALADRRSDVQQWALFACSGLHGDCASLRSPVERLLASKDLGVALMAHRAWPAVDGRNGLLLTMGQGEVLLVTPAAEEVPCTLKEPIQTEMLPNGNLLTASYALQSVQEVRRDGSELWAKGGLEAVVDCQRLPDGNTLVCRHTWHLVQELRPDGEQAWSTKTPGPLLDVDRLANGNTLATQYGTGGVIEIDRDGKTVWSFDGSDLTSAARQLDDTTLVTNRKSGHVLLVEPGGKVLRTWKCHEPWQAELLPSGHVVVNERRAVRILDADGKTAWSLERVNILSMQVLGAGPLRGNVAPANAAPATPPQPK